MSMKSSILHPGRIRDIDPQRSNRGKRDLRTDANSNTDHKIDAVHQLINDTLAPRIAQKSANAVLSDRREYYYFKKKTMGRRCSCYQEETSPEATCPVCYGTGIVGGYDKFGTDLRVVDATSTNLFLNNMELTFEENPRPLFFKLSDGAGEGYMEFDLEIGKNAMKMEHMLVGQPKFNKSTRLEVISPVAKVIEQMEDFNELLEYDKLRIRITVYEEESRPWISHFYFRYHIQEDLRVVGDQANTLVSPELDQFGVYEAFNEIPIFWAGKNLYLYDTEDIIYRLQDGQRLKIVDIKKNLVANTLTSIDSTARFLVPNVDTGAFRIPV